MKKICILGAGCAAINSIGEIANDFDLNYRYRDKIIISYGFISPHLEEINAAQRLGLDLVHEEFKEAYRPIINRKVVRRIDYLAIGKNACKGLPGQNIAKAFEESEKDIDVFLNKLLKGCNFVILIAGFGGKTGTFLIPKLVKKINNMNIKNMSIIEKPYNFEGQKRIEKYQLGIAELENITDNFTIIDILPSEKNSIIEAFKFRDREIAKTTKQIIIEQI